MSPDKIESHISSIPPGYSEVIFRGATYGLSRTDFNEGKSTKIFAEELGGNDYISFNLYRTKNGNLIKACEMPKENVRQFLAEFKFRHEANRNHKKK